MRRSYGDLVPRTRSSTSYSVGPARPWSWGAALQHGKLVAQDENLSSAQSQRHAAPPSSWPSRPSDRSAPTPSVDHAGTCPVPDGQVNGCVQRFWHPQAGLDLVACGGGSAGGQSHVGRACFRVRGDCQNTISVRRPRVNTTGSGARGGGRARRRSPRRVHVLGGIRSTMSSGQAFRRPTGASLPLVDLRLVD